MKVQGWTWVVIAWAVSIGVSVGLTTIGAYGVVLFAFLPLVMGVLTDRTMPAGTTRRALIQGLGRERSGACSSFLSGSRG